MKKERQPTAYEVVERGIFFRLQYRKEKSLCSDGIELDLTVYPSRSRQISENYGHRVLRKMMSSNYSPLLDTSWASNETEKASGNGLSHVQRG